MDIKKELIEIIDDLLQDCYNETIDCENETNLTEKELELIYNNVRLYTLKLKDKIEDRGIFDEKL